MTLGLTLAVVAFACYLGSATQLVALHLRRAGYSPVRDPVSDYGVGSTRRAFGGYVWTGTAGALALAGALAVTASPSVPTWLFGVLLAMVAGRVGLTVFPTDLEGRGRTLTGLLHYACAILNFAAAFVFIRNGTPHLVGAPSWQSVQPAQSILAALAWFALPALVGNCATMVPPLRRVFGLFERIYIATVLGWFTVVSGALAFTLSR